MRAIVLSETGGPEVLRPAEVPDPDPGAGEVVVDLVASALNRRDVWIRTEPGRAALPVVPGSDGAGRVAAVGADVASVSPGDEVVINPSLFWGGSERVPGDDHQILGAPRDGTYAERVAVPAENVRPRPARLSWHEAASLPLAGLTAWRALVTRGELRAGETVLVPGAGSGVATFLVQIAAALGAEVVVTSSSEAKLRRARELGAHRGALYTERDWPERVGPVDLVVDGIGAPVWDGALASLRRGGRLVNFGDTARRPASVALSRFYFGQVDLRGTTMGSPREFDALLGHIGETAWSPVVDHVYPLERAAQAHRRLEEPDRFGKVVLEVRR
jgi:NADPH:quinone reductase-like Zn-dependent oxidoreductase